MPLTPRGFQCQGHGLGAGIVAFNQQNCDGHGLLSSAVRTVWLYRPEEESGLIMRVLSRSCTVFNNCTMR